MSFKKYYQEEKQYTLDGATWNSFNPPVYRKGALYASNLSDCEGQPNTFVFSGSGTVELILNDHSYTYPSGKHTVDITELLDEPLVYFSFNFNPDNTTLHILKLPDVDTIEYFTTMSKFGVSPSSKKVLTLMDMNEVLKLNLENVKIIKSPFNYFNRDPELSKDLLIQFWSNFDTSNVKVIEWPFQYEELPSDMVLDISKWKFSPDLVSLAFSVNSGSINCNGWDFSNSPHLTKIDLGHNEYDYLDISNWKLGDGILYCGHYGSENHGPSFIKVDAKNLDFSKIVLDGISVEELDISGGYLSSEKKVYSLVEISANYIYANNFNLNKSNIVYNFSPGISTASHAKYREIRNLSGESVTSVASLFSNYKVREVILTNWYVPNITDMSNLFSGSTYVKKIDIDNLTTSNVTNMRGAFYGCSGLTSLTISNLDTSNVTDMSHMFYSCTSLTSLDVSSFDTSAVTNMYSMFKDCTNLTSIDISNFDTSNVTDMSWMFSTCTSLTSLDVSSFDTSKVIKMDHMFFNCASLTSLDLSGFIFSHLPYCDISYMFSYCSNLTTLDLSNWNLEGDRYSTHNIFIGCSALNTIYMRNCNAATINKIKSGLTSAGIGNNVTIIT